MKKQCGNIEIECHEAESCGEGFTVFLSVRTSTVKKLNLNAQDARDLRYLLGWALDGCSLISCKITGPHEHVDHGPLINDQGE